MIPENRLSTNASFSPYAKPIREPGELKVDYELAGIGIEDGSAGMMVRVWEAYVKNSTEVWLKSDGVEPQFLFSRDREIHEVSLAFDNNMSPFIAFSEGDPDYPDAYYWWYDSNQGSRVFAMLPSGSRCVRCCIDDHRYAPTLQTDIILTYIRGNSLYFRYQNDRYESEFLLISGLSGDAEIVDVTMNSSLRLQWWMRNTGPIPGASVHAEPILADVVSNLLRRSGLPRESLDLTKIYIPIKGYKVATQAGADALIQPLRQSHFFDVSEYDKKLRFIPRGGEVSASIHADDMLEEDGSPLKMERVQEAELLRKVSLVYVDPASGYAPMTQAAERRSNTVNATSESMTELPLTMSSDEAATVASRRLKVAWAELHKANFRLGVPWSSLTPADVVEVNDHRGNRYRMRVVSITEDAGQFDVECIEDADYAYRSTATGVVPAPPRSTAPGIAGKTEAYPMNLPALRTSDNVPGIYVAAIGTGRGWVGCEFWISADDGQTYSPAGSTDVSSFVGELVDAIGPTDSTFEVEMYTGELHNATPEQLSARQNAFAILTGGVAEIGQFETATEGDPKVYELDEVVRGLLDTTAASHGVGDTFVLLDEAVTFVPVDAAFAGRTLLLKAVSFGASLDQADAVPFLYQPIVRPTQFYRRDDLTAVGGEDTITMDKAPTGLQILRDGVLMTSGYTLSGLVATLSTPATAGEEYTVIYWASEEPAATTLT